MQYHHPHHVLSFVASRTFTSNPACSFRFVRSYRHVWSNGFGAFIQGHVCDDLSQAHWSGRAKKWQRRTPCKQEGSWETDALARTSEFQPVAALAQPLHSLFHSTDHWTLDPPKLLHWMQLSYISHRSYSKKQERHSVHTLSNCIQIITTDSLTSKKNITFSFFHYRRVINRCLQACKREQGSKPWLHIMQGIKKQRQSDVATSIRADTPLKERLMPHCLKQIYAPNGCTNESVLCSTQQA